MSYLTTLQEKKAEKFLQERYTHYLENGKKEDYCVYLGASYLVVKLGYTIIEKDGKVKIKRGNLFDNV